MACIVYLPKEEVDAIEQITKTTGMSRSSVIAQVYYLGKQSSEKK